MTVATKLPPLTSDQLWEYLDSIEMELGRIAVELWRIESQQRREKVIDDMLADALWLANEVVEIDPASTRSETLETTTMNHRLLPPLDVGRQTMTVNGRTYAATPGQVLDVVDFDAGMLEANGWTFFALSGPTSARPSGTLGPNAAVPGLRYLDTTLNLAIVFDGATWRNPVNGASV